MKDQSWTQYQHDWCPGGEMKAAGEATAADPRRSTCPLHPPWHVFKPRTPLLSLLLLRLLLPLRFPVVLLLLLLELLAHDLSCGRRCIIPIVTCFDSNQ